MKGTIFNIQKYAVHDGPGIRTTIFFKGCPLKCQWCHNPESIRIESELSLNRDQCISCYSCMGFTNVEACPTLALEEIGKEVSSDELLDEILKDVVFYDQSKGGVTFSGGEPLLQHEFLLDILKKCKEHNVHTTLDTSGYSKWEHIEKVLPYVDLVLFDLKHIDDQKHKILTGVSNVLIFENLERLLKTNKVYIRVPVIKNINDSEEYIERLCQVLKHENILQINFLPYHQYAENKYEHLMLKTPFKTFEAPTREALQHIIKQCRKNDIKAYIGG